MTFHRPAVNGGPISPSGRAAEAARQSGRVVRSSHHSYAARSRSCPIHGAYLRQRANRPVLLGPVLRDGRLSPSTMTQPVSTGFSMPRPVKRLPTVSPLKRATSGSGEFQDLPLTRRKRRAYQPCGKDR